MQIFGIGAVIDGEITGLCAIADDDAVIELSERGGKGGPVKVPVEAAPGPLAVRAHDRLGERDHETRVVRAAGPQRIELFVLRFGRFHPRHLTRGKLL